MLSATENGGTSPAVQPESPWTAASSSDERELPTQNSNSWIVKADVQEAMPPLNDTLGNRRIDGEALRVFGLLACISRSRILSSSYLGQCFTQ